MKPRVLLLFAILALLLAGVPASGDSGATVMAGETVLVGHVDYDDGYGSLHFAIHRSGRAYGTHGIADGAWFEAYVGQPISRESIRGALDEEAFQIDGDEGGVVLPLGRHGTAQLHFAATRGRAVTTCISMSSIGQGTRIWSLTAWLAGVAPVDVTGTVGGLPITQYAGPDFAFVAHQAAMRIVDTTSNPPVNLPAGGGVGVGCVT